MAARLRPLSFGPLLFSTQLWSKPSAWISCVQACEFGWVQSEIEGKIDLACVKSNGVPATGVIVPNGIEVASVGV